MSTAAPAQPVPILTKLQLECDILWHLLETNTITRGEYMTRIAPLIRRIERATGKSLGEVTS